MLKNFVFIFSDVLKHLYAEYNYTMIWKLQRTFN